MNELEPRSSDRPDLASRVERCFMELIRDRVNDVDVRPYSSELDLEPTEFDPDTEEPVGVEFFLVRATRGAESPHNSRIFRLQIEIMARGTISPSDIDNVEVLLGSAQELSATLRECGERHDVTFPSGKFVSFADAQNVRSGVGIDQQVAWSFSLHAQAREVELAAA